MMELLEQYNDGWEEGKREEEGLMGINRQASQVRLLYFNLNF